MDQVSTQKPQGESAGVTDGGSIIDVADVAMTYATQIAPLQALTRTSLSIARGEFVSLLGPSGCGKTTLLRIVAGLLTPTEGTVTVKGQPVGGPQTEMGVVFQTPILLDWLGVLRNVTLQAVPRPIDPDVAKMRARELLERVGLKGCEQLRPWELSGGMQQRVALCRALLHDPDILMMDEPFGALDSLTRDQMCLDLQKMWTSGEKTVLFVTHDISEAVFLSDRVVVMAPSPGRVDVELKIDLPRPRRLATRDTDAFFQYCRTIRRAFERRGILREED
jgi:NitT/TauT family transport system ATP-binding protein